MKRERVEFPDFWNAGFIAINDLFIRQIIPYIYTRPDQEPHWSLGQ